MSEQVWVPPATVSSTAIEVRDTDDRFPRVVTDPHTDQVRVQLSSSVSLWFESMTAYDRWQEKLDRTRAAIGFQQTFDGAA